jgi:hypothetical protein
MNFIDTDTGAGERREHPVDVVERLAAVNEWTFDRAETDEISILVSGKFANYDVAFTWLPDMESLHVSCSFDLKTPAHKRAAIGELTQLINEQLWLGHFDQWSQQDVVMFRHALCLAGGAGANDAQCTAVVNAALGPAKPITRRSSSSCGPTASRARRWRSRLSRPAARREARPDPKGSIRRARTNSSGRPDTARRS